MKNCKMLRALILKGLKLENFETINWRKSMQKNKSGSLDGISINLPMHVRDEIYIRTNNNLSMSGIIEDIIVKESKSRQITKKEAESMKKKRRFNVQITSNRVRELLDSRLKELGNIFTVKDYVILAIKKNLQRYQVNALKEKIVNEGLNITQAATKIGISRAKLSEVINHPDKPLSGNILKKIDDYFNGNSQDK